MSLGPDSWDGGLSPTTVFWAVRLPHGSAHVDLDAGTASLHVENVCVLDAFTVGNSVAGVNRTVNPAKGIINSLHIEWSGISKIETANQPGNTIHGMFLQNTARISVTATTP